MRRSQDRLMAKKPEIMTTTRGNPVADNQNFTTPDIRQWTRSGAVKGKLVAATN